MRTQRVLTALCFLLIAILSACNLPAGKNATQPNVSGTAAPQALVLQAFSTPTESLTSTPAVAETSVAVRAAKSTNGHPSPAAQAAKYTEKEADKVVVAVKDASKATAK